MGLPSTAKGDRRMTRTRRTTSMRVLTRLTLAAMVSGFVTPTGAQQPGTGRITGSVTDRTAGAPVPNVSVTVTGTTLGGRTGTDGKYTIADVPAGVHRIHLARIGYSPSDQQVTVSAGQTTTTNVSLSAASVTLDQMVVVGYGAQRRSDLTGSVASVTPNVAQTPTLSLNRSSRVPRRV